MSGLVKDMDDSFIPDNSWSHTRNASKVTAVGSLDTLSNESSTLLCSLLPYPSIGFLHLFEDKWVVFSTDNTNSEIGLFDDSQCSYHPIVQDPCLDPITKNPVVISCPGSPPYSIPNTNELLFNTLHLITGATKQNFDCSWQVYWQDGWNPDRTLAFTIDPQGIPTPVTFYMKQCCVDSAGNTPGTSGYPTDCNICTPTYKIDPQKALLASLVNSPCITVSMSRSGGSLLNGSYFAVIAYTINQQKITDYFPPSNSQALFSHNNLSGALDISFTGLDTEHFEEFELVIVRNINQQTSAKKIGIYSTQTKSISIDYINEALPTVPIQFIPIQTPVFEKSELMTSVGDYLVRTAPTTKFDFNYQPLANRIQAKWVSVEYPSDYYRKGGNKPSLLRDEIYPFFIRWIYDTGDRSADYHIPGRAPRGNELGAPSAASDIITSGERQFEVQNTASMDPGAPANPNLPDGGVIIAKGDMAYWESTEKYPDNKHQVWDLSNWSTIPGWSTVPGMGSAEYDLCGKNIRHHKMPDNLTIGSQPNHPDVCNHINFGASKIRILGVEFNNIHAPLDNNGNPIQGIVGYEILRGSREGNKTILAKGMVNNTRTYFNPQNQLEIYQNYPYNYTGTDDSLVLNSPIPVPLPYNPPTGDRILTFHSPDTQFKHPFLAVNELKQYGILLGDISGQFEDVPEHPKEKLLTNLAFAISAILGIAEAMIAMRGKRTHRLILPRVNNIGLWQDKYTVKAQSARTGGGGAFTAGTGTISPQGGGGRAAYDVPDVEAPNDDATKATGDLAKDQVEARYNDILSAIFGQGGLIGTYGSDSQGYGVAGLANLFLSGGAGYDKQDADTWKAATTDTLKRPGIDYGTMEIDIPDTNWKNQPFQGLSHLITFSYYWTMGADTLYRFFQAVVPYEQYALRYRSAGQYNRIVPGTSSRRYQISDINYLSNQIQSFQNINVNNLYRSEAVILSALNNGGQALGTPAGPLSATLYYDYSDDGINSIDAAGNNVRSNTIVSLAPGPSLQNPGVPFSTKSSSYYAALIQRIKNQYGQLDSIQQVPTSCPQSINPTLIEQVTEVLFPGDTYITRYTEKNTFFYFYDWLMNQPDGYEYNYRLRYMVTNPRYWADFTKYDVGEFLGSNSSPGSSGGFFSTPSSRHNLDGDNPSDTTGKGSPFILGALNAFGPIRLRVKDAYFYLFQSGVRDFYVESEVNTDLRDYGDLPEERFYDPYSYTDTYSLFDPKIIKSGNYFKYDYSLSISRLFQNFISWGNLQPRSYDPLVAETCYVKNDKRLIYSLPQNTENKKDFWRVFLANNYKDFDAVVSGIKAYNQNGAVILFQSASPILWKGTDTLETDIGTKITLGDGGLFAQPPQSIINTDVSLEYGSCQDSRSVLNTPFGLYYMCTNQGKIFHITESLQDITYHGLKFWFKEYLPYWLLKSFPGFTTTQNPVTGIGCQSVYDNQIETIYFCKKDYKLIDGIIPYSSPTTGTLEYLSGVSFKDHLTGLDFDLGVPDTVSNGVIIPAIWKQFFQDASFTVSYDPKAQKGGWISFHDWHPDLVVPSKNSFLSTQYFIDPVTNILTYGIHRHNSRRDSFCEYYGVQYPFEVEWIASTQFTVNTLRSIEYYLECYQYPTSRLDRFHILDENFDQAVVYNTEQVSGILQLFLTPKNNPFARLNFPFINVALNRTDILFSKEEQKYRFNQGLVDITRNRGEFPPPIVNQPIWVTDPNGYTRTLNQNNLDLTKASFQRKKMRHYLTKISLVKRNSGNANYLVKACVEKNLLSIR